MTNGMDPNMMTAEERLAEVSMLLSLAMMRLWARRRAGAPILPSPERAFSRDFSLGSPAEIRPPVAVGEP